MHPDFDCIVEGILRRDVAGKVAFIGSDEAWCARLRQRFADQMGSLANRVVFLPPQTAASFCQLLSSADVLLDTIHFGGGVTAFEMIWSQTPFVTTRSTYMRGRATAGLCDLLIWRQR